MSRARARSDTNCQEGRGVGAGAGGDPSSIPRYGMWDGASVMHEEDMVRPRPSFAEEKNHRPDQDRKVKKSTHAIVLSPLDSDDLDFNICRTGTVRAHCTQRCCEFCTDARWHDNIIHE